MEQVVNHWAARQALPALSEPPEELRKFAYELAAKKPFTTASTLSTYILIEERARGVKLTETARTELARKASRHVARTYGRGLSPVRKIVGLAALVLLALAGCVPSALDDSSPPPRNDGDSELSCADIKSINQSNRGFLRVASDCSQENESSTNSENTRSDSIN